MPKKFAIFAVLVTAPFLSSHFRQGFKEGWNENSDRQRALGRYAPPKFKNV